MEMNIRRFFEVVYNAQKPYNIYNNYKKTFCSNNLTFKKIILIRFGGETR